jgi:hypothetical protein
LAVNRVDEKLIRESQCVACRHFMIILFGSC